MPLPDWFVMLLWQRRQVTHVCENCDEARPLPLANQFGVKVRVSALAPAARLFTDCTSSGWPELPWAACTAGVAALMASDSAGWPAVWVSARPFCTSLTKHIVSR